MQETTYEKGIAMEKVKTEPLASSQDSPTDPLAALVQLERMIGEIRTEAHRTTCSLTGEQMRKLVQELKTALGCFESPPSPGPAKAGGFQAVLSLAAEAMQTKTQRPPGRSPLPNPVAPTGVGRDVKTLDSAVETRNDVELRTSEVNHLLSRGGVLPSPEEIQALFTKLPSGAKEKREAVVGLIRDVAREGLAHLEVQAEALTQPTKGATLYQILRASLPLGHEDSLQLLEEATLSCRNEATLPVLRALDAYLATHEATENPKITNLIERRLDLIRQKEELAAEVSACFESLGLQLCGPSGRPANLRVLADTNNTKGQYRLIPHGSAPAEKVRANLRDMLPFLRFNGAESNWDLPEKDDDTRPQRPATGPGRS